MTKEKFLEVLNKLPSKLGWCPTLNNISKELQLPRYKISRMLKMLSESGDVIRVHNWYRFPEPVIKKEEADGSAASIVNIRSSNNLWNSTVGKIKDPSLMILRIIMLFVGIGASFISAYYTTIWGQETLIPIIAWTIAILINAFNVAAFDIMIGLILGVFTKKKIRFIAAGFFCLVWIIGLFLSIGATVAGQYNKYNFAKAEISMAYNDENIYQIELENIRASKEDKNRTREENRNRLNILLEQTSKENMEENWITLQSRILATQNIIRNLDAEIEMLREKEIALLNNRPEIRIKNEFKFYQWLGKVISRKEGNEDYAQFWMNLGPALFFDLVAPISIAIFLFLKRKNESESL